MLSGLETNTNHLGLSSLLTDDIDRLRYWGSDRVHDLPTAPTEPLTIGSSAACSLRLIDPQRFVSRSHARLSREEFGWLLRDTQSKNGVWADGKRWASVVLAPGTELAVGSLRLIAESPRLVALHAFLSRIIGWDELRRADVDRALRVVRDFASGQVALLLCGEGDLVPVARWIHEQVVGADHPLIVSEPSAPTGVALAALRAARGGTWCVRTRHLPAGFGTARAELDHPATSVRLIVCSGRDEPPAIASRARVDLPPLAQRAHEIDRVIDAFAAEALVAVEARASSFVAADRDWVRRNRSRTLAEIQTATRRLVALRHFGGVTRAAEFLSISHVALSKWRRRR